LSGPIQPTRPSPKHRCHLRAQKVVRSSNEEKRDGSLVQPLMPSMRRDCLASGRPRPRLIFVRGVELGCVARIVLSNGTMVPRLNGMVLRCSAFAAQFSWGRADSLHKFTRVASKATRIPSYKLVVGGRNYGCTFDSGTVTYFFNTNHFFFLLTFFYTPLFIFFYPITPPRL